MATYTDFGIALPLGATGECRTTCPRCSPSRRKSYDQCLAVHASEGVWHCWHCGWSGCLAHKDGQRPSVPMMHQPPRTPDARRREAMEQRWQAAAPPTVGDPVYRYLRSRGLVLPLREMPPHVRYHARLPYRHDDGTLTYHPAMLARVDNPDSAMVTLHRTYLRISGGKANVPTIKK